MEIESALIKLVLTVEEAASLADFIDLACRDDTSTTSERVADSLRQLLIGQLRP